MRHAPSTGKHSQVKILLFPNGDTPEVERRPRGVPEKCSFCYQTHRPRPRRWVSSPGVDADATPACCGVCPTGARIFGDLNDPEFNCEQGPARTTPSYRLRENLGTGPRVYYLPAVAPRKEA